MGEPAKRGFDLVQEDHKLNGDGGEALWVKTLQRRPKDQPFFMWFASYDAHRPWGANDMSGHHTPDRVSAPPYLVDANGAREDLAAYHAEASRFDQSIGEVDAELDRQGICDHKTNGKASVRARGCRSG